MNRQKTYEGVMIAFFIISLLVIGASYFSLVVEYAIFFPGKDDSALGVVVTAIFLLPIALAVSIVAGILSSVGLGLSINAARKSCSKTGRGFAVTNIVINIFSLLMFIFFIAVLVIAQIKGDSSGTTDPEQTEALFNCVKILIG